MCIMEEKQMNKTEIVIKLSFPAILITGFVCYKVGELSGSIKTAKAFLDEKSKEDTKD